MPLMAATTIADEKEARVFYQRLDDAFVRNDVKQMISLLAELDSVEVWSFGAGVGPTDSESLQCRIVQIIVEHFLDEKGHVKGYEQVEIIAALNENAKMWLGVLRTSPSDHQTIMQLLLDKKAAMRWVGLKKAALATQLDVEMIGVLRHIMANDSYVQISRKPVGTDENRPSPPGLTVNELIFPLRVIACQVLNAKGHSCVLDDMALAREGVKAIAQMWEDQPKRRAALEDAISLLNPSGLGAKAVRELGSNASPTSAFSAFLLKVDEN